MERCIYNNDNLYAVDVKTDFELEKYVRTIGKKRILLCANCLKPVIYKRGEIRDAHFAHIDNSDECDYARFSKLNSKRSKAWKEVKEILYNHFASINSNNKVIKDDRIINKHWTDLSIEINGIKLGIEIDDKTMTANKLDGIKNEYKQKNIRVDWVILDKLSEINKESEVYYIKRAFLNEDNNTLIVVDKNNYQFAMYKLDTKKYFYSNSKIPHKFKEDIFAYKFT